MKNSDVISQAMYYGLFFGAFETIKFIFSVNGAGSHFFGTAYFLCVLATPVLAFIFARRFSLGSIIEKVRFGNIYSFTVFLLFFSAMILGVSQYIYMQFINPEFLSSTLSKGIEVFKDTDFLGQYQEMVDKQGTPTAIEYIMSNIYISMMYGAIIGLPVALIVSKLTPKHN
ncbi:MAG: DUF4199 domain-containing protein [Bacteroidales bacterium]